MTIIGIAGGTGSGKTTVVKRIISALPPRYAAVVPLDSYYNDTTGMTDEERKAINFDHPDAFDTDMLIQHIINLKNNKAVEAPIYSFADHNRIDKTLTIKPNKVILVEGILIFENPALRDLMDIKIFVDADADIRFIRRLERDILERKRDLNSVINQYCSTVKPMHEQFVEPSKKHADIIVPKGGNNLIALNMIIEKIKSII